ncbi:MAG: amidophosphoribosyltransferase [Bacilli bacterium]|nr:amidophosphoribosyltransferase [Bacilli bacterium]
MSDVFDTLHEECGVFGVFNIEKASELTYFGLHSLQHRGQEGCGMVVGNNGQLTLRKGEGLITEVFKRSTSLTEGNIAIGHVRYSTAGGGGLANVQPFLFHHKKGDFALAHNGNIVNSAKVKEFLEDRGSIFQSTSDSEILAHLLISNHDVDRLKSISESLKMLEGGFSFLILTKDALYACRDMNGLRPLSLAKYKDGYVVASETCAIDAVGAEFVRDIEPGEIVAISKDGIKSVKYTDNCKHNMCAMEYIYFARPDSDIEGTNCHYFRKQSGIALARTKPVDADIVIGVPDSSLSAAIGYAEESHIPFETGLLKNKYIGRTFIQPSQELREKAVKMKLSVIKSIVKGKRVILIDDSIVRGTTSRKIVSSLKEAGAIEVHVRIASPEISHPCFYGVDISSYDELISANNTVEEVKEKIGADSLAFLPVEELYKISNRCGLCTACFEGKYPTEIYSEIRHKKI